MYEMCHGYKTGAILNAYIIPVGIRLICVYVRIYKRMIG